APSFTGYEHAVFATQISNRYYDPATAGFMSSDPWRINLSDLLSTNLYNYVQGNPINITDPLGLFNWQTNTTESGDTLGDIAYVLDLSWSDLYNYGNNASLIGTNPNYLRVGLVLDIPSCYTAICSTRLAERLSAYTGTGNSQNYQKSTIAPASTPNPNPQAQITPVPTPAPIAPASLVSIPSVPWIVAQVTCGISWATDFHFDHAATQLFTWAMLQHFGRPVLPEVAVAGAGNVMPYGCVDLVEVSLLGGSSFWEVKSRGTVQSKPGEVIRQMERYDRAFALHNVPGFDARGKPIIPFVWPKLEGNTIKLINVYSSATIPGVVVYENDRGPKYKFEPETYAAPLALIAAYKGGQYLGKLMPKIPDPVYNNTSGVLTFASFAVVAVGVGVLLAIVIIAGVPVLVTLAGPVGISYAAGSAITGGAAALWFFLPGTGVGNPITNYQN
ncbi:MAG TPA: RHS repeat-associated core domain-containing protein, partial [Anaerolineales bacterium]|nr:RHS repeat-associated core domain-containing protein [Anaerolineales bacterium]